MAVVIITQPSYPNVTHTNLVYEVNSSQANQPQMQYIMDVKAGATTLARIKQYPNPQGKAVFDPAKIFNDYLEYPTSIINQPLVQNFGTSDRTFQVFFGEQYSTNFTNPVTVYDGNDNVGNPAVQGQNARVFPGTVDPNNGISFNWLDLHTNPTWLTDYPANPADENDYHKLHMNDMALLGAYGGGQANMYLLNSAGSQIYSINLGSIDTLAYIPVGPANLLSRGVPQATLDQTAISYVTLQSSSNRYYYKWEESCFYDRTNFIFINKYGAWDNFSITLPPSKNTTVSRDELKRPFVNYSNDGRYDNLRRGRDYFNLDFTDTYTVSSDWLSQTQADWLTQLIESPKVYIQSNGGRLTPIVITNSNYTWYTNNKSQKTFEFEIEYQLSNSRRSVQ